MDPIRRWKGNYMKSVAQIQQFTNPEFGSIRATEINGEPWFISKDVAVVLGYQNARDAIYKHVDDEDKGVAKCDTPGGVQEMTIISKKLCHPDKITIMELWTIARKTKMSDEDIAKIVKLMGDKNE